VTTGAYITPPAAVAATTSVAQPLVAPRLSIVVLPFVNLSNDPEQQYFADGITEDLTTDLSRLADMLVISRNSAFTYKDKPVNARQIGRELGYVLEGSVQRAGAKIRINAQLIDAQTTPISGPSASTATSAIFSPFKTRSPVGSRSL
jgi:adenylate cyclase